MNDGQGVFLVVEASALPEIFSKVLEAKELLENGACPSVQAAAARVGISRSAFYKYRDSVFRYKARKYEGAVTFAMNLDDVPGLLSNVLNFIASSGANILTISQTMPLRGIAGVTMTVEFDSGLPSDIFEQIHRLPGVRSLKIIRSENHGGDSCSGLWHSGLGSDRGTQDKPPEY